MAISHPAECQGGMFIQDTAHISVKTLISSQQFSFSLRFLEKDSLRVL